MPSAVAMSNVTPPGPAGAERLTVKVKEVVPAFPSFRETSLTVRLGGTTPPWGVSEKSSTDRPSSAPVASISVQRIQNVAPLAMLKPGIIEESAVRSAAALPFLAPTVTVSGVTKLSGAWLVQVPVVRSVALVLYSKLIWSVRPAVPRRHSSPV